MKIIITIDVAKRRGSLRSGSPPLDWLVSRFIHDARYMPEVQSITKRVRK